MTDYLAELERERDALESAAPALASSRVDVAMTLAGGLVRPMPELGHRNDGQQLLYRSAVNGLVGPPEAGKSWVALTVMAQLLNQGQRVLYCDVDHNGPAALLSRLQALGISDDLLADESLTWIDEPQDAVELDALVSAMNLWQPQLAVFDSVGEVLGLFAADANSDADYTAVHRRVFTPLALAGAAVLTVDHEAKAAESARYGASGAVAKKRAVDGVLLRCTVMEPFVPGQGGSVALSIVKDRHGGVREASAQGDREPLAGVLRLEPVADGQLRAAVWAPAVAALPPEDELETLRQLDPPPRTVRDVQHRLHWGAAKATRALREYRAALQRFSPKGERNTETPHASASETLLDVSETLDPTPTR